MPQHSEPDIAQLASLQASEWFVLLNSGKAAARQQLDFEQWLAQSPLHRKAWQETQTLWQGLEQFSPADIVDLKNSLPTIHQPTSPRYFTPIRFAFGAMAFLLVIQIYRQPFWYADYYTGAGESNKFVLSDGSTVELNTDSAISVEYSNNRRQLVLHQGEAYFSVAADAARPFEVVTGEVEIRALGTAFDVSREGDDMQVTVFEHAVRVSVGEQRIAKLSSGNSVSFKGHQLSHIIPENLATIDSWRQHRLIFEDRQLGEVIKSLNRYRHLPIFILGNNVKNLSVTGVFDTQDTDTALQTIQETLAVNIRRLPGGIVLLTGV